MNNANAQLALRWFDELWNQRRTATIDELLTPDSIGHLAAGDVHGIEDFKARARRVHQGDPRLDVERGGRHRRRGRSRGPVERSGCHSGDGFGSAATNRPVSFRGVTWLRCRDGKLIEGWDNWDYTAFLQGLRG